MNSYLNEVLVNLLIEYRDMDCIIGISLGGYTRNVTTCSKSRGTGVLTSCDGALSRLPLIVLLVFFGARTAILSNQLKKRTCLCNLGIICIERLAFVRIAKWRSNARRDR
ncbi:hypothetical protein TNCV_4871561 [Trichonephila clavipes]|nr:hypothetical protein TNCV_4871561 [Trichonephila clavipes]